MLAYVLLTFLNTSHGASSQTRIKTDAIVAMRTPQDNIGCALSHKDIEREMLVSESCETVAELMAKSKEKPEKAAKAKEAKVKKAQGWVE